MTQAPHDGAAIIRAARLLGDLLATDIQHYAPAIAGIEQALSALHADARAKPVAIHGNVYTLTLHLDHAQITNANDPTIAPERLSLTDFAAAFRHWVTLRD